MKEKNLELYIHLPFCVRKCLYCDFLSGAYDSGTRQRYLETLGRELELAAPDAARYRVATVFFGGGTPSLLSGGEMRALLEQIRGSYRLEQDAEITMEGNPGTFTRENLEAYREAGVNRLSIGCQSAHDRELRRLGRIHTFRDFRESYQEARDAGFANINVDLMSGLPGQTLQDWEESLRVIAEMGPEHISAYSLIIEEGTPFAGMRLDLPEEETERRMYEVTEGLLGEYGYSIYEISNYARPGRECRHNIGYWKRENYLGFGLGASSMMENVRFSNTGDMKEYLEARGEPAKIRRDIQRLSVPEQMEEFMFLGMRMREGVSEAEFQSLFRRDIQEVYGTVLEKYQALRLLERLDGRIFLTRQGVHVSNQVFADFLLDESEQMFAKQEDL